MSIRFYEVSEDYIDYLSNFDEHFFHNSQDNQRHSRKYIGVVFSIENTKYFAPLSSFKEKHKTMKSSVDFLKVGNYAVINLNNMFPVPDGLYSSVDFHKEKDIQYRRLMMNEYRIIKKMQDKILKNARIVYNHKLNEGNTTSLGKRCNDFTRLESACARYGYDSFVAQRLMESDAIVKESKMEYYSEEITIKLEELLNQQNQYYYNSEVTPC